MKTHQIAYSSPTTMADSTNSYPRFRMNHIMVPVDFSPTSKDAFMYALNLGSQFQAQITLVHAYSPAIVEPYMAPYMQEALMEQEEQLALKFFAELENEVPPSLLEKVAVDYKLSLGPAVEEILKLSEELKPDQIVMGMRGSNPLSRHLIGSTAAEVVQRAKAPVWIIPEGSIYKPIQHLAYATNFEPDDPKIIDQLLSFADSSQARLHCVHVRHNEQAADVYRQEILRKAYAQDTLENHIDFTNIDYENVVEGLNHYIESENIDLLVMLTHKRNLLGRLFQKSHTRNMVYASNTPLWAFHVKAEK